MFFAIFHHEFLYHEVMLSCKLMILAPIFDIVENTKGLGTPWQMNCRSGGLIPSFESGAALGSCSEVVQGADSSVSWQVTLGRTVRRMWMSV